jgi:type IV secretory pathway TrbD component
MPSIEEDAHYTVHLPDCPYNGIHGIVTCAFCNELTNKSVPAAPAPRKLAKSLPSARSTTRQPSYAPRAATPLATLAPGLSRYDDNVEAWNPVYQSLQRPKLLRGGEWQLSVVNNLVAAGFVILTIMTWNWRFLLGAIWFGWAVQWLIRLLGRHDPKWWHKYLRYNRQPLVREPHGHPERSAPAPRILPKKDWLIH